MAFSDPDLGQETIGENEAAVIDEIVGMNLKTLKDDETPTRRAQHPQASRLCRGDIHCAQRHSQALAARDICAAR